jgi:flagellar hook assembly protein FlgD
MPSAGRVDVAVVGVDGRRIATLASGTLPAGRHTLSWNGHDARGARVAPGVYFVRATSPSGRGIRKVTLLH